MISSWRTFSKGKKSSNNQLLLSSKSPLVEIIICNFKLSVGQTSTIEGLALILTSTGVFLSALLFTPLTHCCCVFSRACCSGLKGQEEEEEDEAWARGRVRAPATAFADGFGILRGIFFSFFLTFGIKKEKKKRRKSGSGDPWKSCSYRVQ